MEVHAHIIRASWCSTSWSSNLKAS